MNIINTKNLEKNKDFPNNHKSTNLKGTIFPTELNKLYRKKILLKKFNFKSKEFTI